MLLNPNSCFALRVVHGSALNMRTLRLIKVVFDLLMLYIASLLPIASQY